MKEERKAEVRARGTKRLIVRMVGASKHRRKVWRAEGIGGRKHNN